MNESGIIQKLKKLQSIQPNKDWEAKQHSVMEAQVYNGELITPREPSRFSNFLLLFKATFSQPGIMVGTILTIIIVGGGLTTYVVGRQAKPGDSLYFTKEINDQVKLAMRFDREEQNKLKLAMAQERVTEMANLDKEADKEKAEAISKEFQATLNEVKEGLTAINNTAPVVTRKKEAVSTPDNNQVKTTEDTTTNDATATTSLEDGAFSVATGQTKDGRIEISEPVNVSARQMIEEAETLFANADYDGTIDKLQAASELLDSAK